jgi:hypothetical protein
MKSSVRLPRRVFLHALGAGAALSALAPTIATAQGARRPVRLFMMFVPHGFPLEHFDPVDADGTLNLSAKGIGGFSPFEPYRSSVTVLRGVGMANGASNHMAIRAALTGFPEGATSRGASVDSIDYVIAKALGVVPHVLGAQPYKKSESWSVNSWLNRHGGAWVRPIESPIEAAAGLFKGVGAPQGVDESAFEKEALALDSRQVARLLANVRGSGPEEAKLKIHLRALENLRTAGANEIRVCSAVPMLPAVAATAGLDPLDEAQFGKVLDAHLEAAAHAMVCASARVITLQALWVTSNTRFDFAGGPNVPMEHHVGLSHSSAPRDLYAKAQQWMMSRVADKLLSVLNQPDPADPAHTVLDNSVVYITTEIADGANHTSNAGPMESFGLKMWTYLPQILIGGGGGYFRAGGRAVRVDDNRPHTDVLATIAAAMGVVLTQIGDQPVRVVEELKA